MNSCSLGLILLLAPISLPASPLFSDDFEQDLSRWEVPDQALAHRVESGDPSHRMVLEITPNNTAQCVLIRDSARWERYRVEGEVLFPAKDDSYFGFVYGHQQSAGRSDFGNIYVKGNGSYIAVNPHRDGNASRALYEERTVYLPADQKIEIGHWYPFKAEVIGSTCHFYFQNMQTPCMTFSDWEYAKGNTGFKPRLAGSPCWIDNIRVFPIAEFAWKGAPLPEKITYHPERMLTQWKAIGPFCQHVPELESAQLDFIYKGKPQHFSKFATDSRGCLVTGRICRYTTEEKIAYFLTSYASGKGMDAWLEVSSTDEIGVWVNSIFVGNVPKREAAWYDFDTNPKHNGTALKIRLRPGNNDILICVKGGNYSGDGLFARIATLSKETP